MSSPQSTPLRKGKRKSAPLDVEVASATKKSRTSLQSTVISEAAVNGNVVSGRKRKSVSKSDAVDNDSESISLTVRGKKRLSSSSDAVDPVLQESSSSSSGFQNTTMSASKTRASLSRSSSVSELAAAAASTPRKAVRRGTPIQDATPSHGRGRASRLQPITEVVPNVSLPVIPLDMPTESISHVSPPVAPIAPAAVTTATAPVIIATNPLAPTRIVLQDTWYSWLSALIIVALVTSSMLSNLGILPSPAQILPKSTFFSSSVHSNNYSMMQSHITDHIEAGQTIAAVEILNQSLNSTAFEITTLLAEIEATHAEEHLNNEEVVTEEVIISQEHEQSIVLEEALSKLENSSTTLQAAVLEVEEKLTATTNEIIEEFSDEIIPADLSQDQVQAAIEVVSEATQETNREAQAALEVSHTEETEFVNILSEHDTDVVEDQGSLEANQMEEIETLTTDIDHLANATLEEQEEVAALVEEQQEVDEKNVIKEKVAVAFDSFLHTANNHKSWHRTNTHHDHPMHVGHPTPAATTVAPMYDSSYFVTTDHDLALGLRETKLDDSALSLANARSTGTKQGNALAFIMQPLDNLFKKKRLLYRLNSNKPLQDLSDSCVYFNHHKASSAVIVRLMGKIKIANISSIAITHLIPNTTEAEAEQAKGCAVKDFTVHNMDQARDTVSNFPSFSNQIGDFSFSFNDINNANIMTIKTEVSGGTVIKQIFHLPAITTMKSIGFNLRSLQDEKALKGCLCRVHVYGKFAEDDKKRRNDEEKQQQQLLM